MTAFFIATVAVKDKAKFAEYAAKAAETFEPFGGQPVLRGQIGDTLLGTRSAANAVGAVSFPNMDALRAWFGSDAYQALAPLRDEAADMTILACETPQ